jgi:hypothetical protein
LSHDSSPFYFGHLGDGVSQTICLDWPRTMILPISASQVASIIAMSHQHPAWQLLRVTHLSPLHCLWHKCFGFQSPVGFWCNLCFPIVMKEDTSLPKTRHIPYHPGFQWHHLGGIIIVKKSKNITWS